MFGAFARLINAKYFLQTSHKIRQWFVTIGMTLGFMLISWCVMGTQGPNGIDPNKEYKFWLSLVASVIIGVTTALGEANVVSLLKGFPSKTIGFFGSGTGFAGISGTSMLIIMNAVGMKDWQIYMTAAPTMIPYIYCCLWLINKSRQYPFVPEENLVEVAQDEQETKSIANKTEDYTSIDDQDESQQSGFEVGVSDNEQLTWKRFVLIMGKVGLLMSNLTFVYFFEYSITTSFGIEAVNQLCIKYPECKSAGKFIKVQAFVIMNFCY